METFTANSGLSSAGLFTEQHTVSQQANALWRPWTKHEDTAVVQNTVSPPCVFKIKHYLRKTRVCMYDYNIDYDNWLT